MATVNIKGLDKAELLAAFYNNAKPMGMGFLHFDPKPMTREDALKMMEVGDDHARMFPGIRGGRTLYFDYVKGRCLKIDLSGDEMRTDLFDRDYGQGAGEDIIAEVRARTGG